MKPIRQESRSYFDTRFNAPMIAVSPGGHAVTAMAEEMLTTLLGSCVAACLYDSDAGIGGMNHFLLPHGPRATHGGPDIQSLAYGDHAMEVLINAILKRGGRKERMAAKMFGGATMQTSLDHYAVGQRNIAFCESFLRKEGIPIVASDVGGNVSRRIVFHPARGRAHVHQLTAQQISEVTRSEARYARDMSAPKKPAAVELF